MMDRETDKIREILQEMPEPFQMARDGVDISIQKEYVSYTAHLDLDQYSEENIAVRMQRLFDSNASLEEKKETLIVLANRGTVEGYRTIERFLKTAEQHLADWAALALQECRMMLENALLDKSIGIIMTGLGGEDNRMRYFVVVCPENDTRFTSAQEAILERGFSSICRSFNAILEEMHVHRNYATMKMLIPLDVAVGDVIEGGIDKCNTAGGLLDINYFVTNVTIPTETEFLPILQEMSNRDE